jgi:hypothetical protein
VSCVFSTAVVWALTEFERRTLKNNIKKAAALFIDSYICLYYLIPLYCKIPYAQLKHFNHNLLSLSILGTSRLKTLNSKINL